MSVKRMGTHIANSPFKIMVGEREVGDAKKVRTSGSALKEGLTHSENTFNVDTRNAGYKEDSFFLLIYPVKPFT